MTLAQLEAATARLGFTPTLDDGGELLRDAATRAIGEVALARPRITRASLWHYPDVPIYCETGSEVESEARDISVGGGSAYHLRILGRGRLVITRGEERREYSFSAPEGSSPAILGNSLPSAEGPITFRIEPTDSFRLLSFAVYEGAYAGIPPDPISPKEYNLRSYFPDFGALVGPLTGSGHELLTEGYGGDYSLRDGYILTLYRDLPCRVEITYRRTLTLPTAAEGKLPVTDEEAALLPLYCAGYVFLDDDPEKAAFYLARFTEGLRRLSHEASQPTRYRDTTGWG